ncbi:Os06g0547301 [Oryza sativa Japonica Group]|uniref:Os06g0547301 protein n=1 Tax=Oryza sativa subsp. japonica TaxID=39947 RepID=A0A0P0WY12_ORYSJ|nr:Os06g0547301 [Oryza sativa Japonica Group]
MWDPCTGAPSRPTFVHRSSLHTHRQLLLTPRSPPPPLAAPHCAKPASSTGHASRQFGLPPSAAPLAPSRPPSPLPAPLAPSRPPLPSAALLCAKPISDPSTHDAAPARCNRLPRPRQAV